MEERSLYILFSTFTISLSSEFVEFIRAIVEITLTLLL